MTWRYRFEQAKARLLSDAAICTENRQLFADFFAYEEYKLKRQNGLPDLDEACCKTLYGYVLRFRRVNGWFRNCPWIRLTKEDIRLVYDALEDGRIRNAKGLPFQDRASYYNKVFKSKPFRLAGKADLAKDVIEFSTSQKKAVRYVTEEEFRRLVSAVINPHHLLLLWLCWDIGENIDTLLQLTKRDFILQVNRQSGEREYLVQLTQSKLKRSRTSRSEPTLYPETARLLDQVLPQLQLGQQLFSMGYRAATKSLKRVVRRSGATTMPDAQPVRFKDLRSGMACHLLRCGWSRDEVNARLGHTPRSAALDAYINFLALDRDRSKQRLRQSLSDAQPADASPPPSTTAIPVIQSQQTIHSDPESASLQLRLSALQDELKAIQSRLSDRS